MAVTLLGIELELPAHKFLLAAANRVLESEDYADADVSIVLSDNDTLHELNLQYRGKDKPTDVLSFSQLETASEDPLLPNQESLPINLGDVIISVERAKHQALEHRVTIEEELALLTVHGILHLVGYEDETDAGVELMRKRETELGVRG